MNQIGNKIAFGMLLRFVMVAGITLPATILAEEEFTSEDIDVSVERAVDYLVSRQHPIGCFSDERPQDFKDRRDFRPPRHATAMTALAIMGMASVGHLPTDPTDEGKAMAEALDFATLDVLINRNGYFGERDGSQMYGHGITTLMFAEMLGMGKDEEQDKLIRERLTSGIDLILRSQKMRKSGGQEGGWRYTPESNDSDISATVWQLMALRAAKNAGLDVPKKAIDDAVVYVKNCFQRRGGSRREGEDAKGFSYQHHGGHQGTSTTAAGMLSLQVCGEYDCEEVLEAADNLLRNPPRYSDSWFFYASYYYSQAMSQRQGEYAATAKEMTKNNLLQIQQRDGSWMARNGNERGAGRIYSTSMALLSLSVHHHYLPIYQR